MVMGNSAEELWKIRTHGPGGTDRERDSSGRNYSGSSEPYVRRINPAEGAWGDFKRRHSHWQLPSATSQAPPNFKYTKTSPFLRSKKAGLKVRVGVSDASGKHLEYFNGKWFIASSVVHLVHRITHNSLWQTCCLGIPSPTYAKFKNVPEVRPQEDAENC